MTRQEHLLCILGEECNEVAHQVSKVLRFGSKDIYDGMDDAERLAREVDDVLAVVELVREGGLLRASDPKAVQLKREKVAYYMRYADLKCGTIQTEDICAR